MKRTICAAIASVHLAACTAITTVEGGTMDREGRSAEGGVLALILRLVCAALSIPFAACTILSAPAPMAQARFEGKTVRVGEQIGVLTTAGVEHVFEVVSQTPDRICGKDRCIGVHEIRTVRREQIDVAGTTGAVALGALYALPLVNLAAAPFVIAGMASRCMVLPPAMLREPRAMESSGPVAQARTDELLASLDAVIVRNGPGSWALDAVWDEYRFRIRSQSARDLRVVRVTLFDAQGVGIASTNDAGALFEASRWIHERYRASALTSLSIDAYGCRGRPSGRQFAATIRSQDTGPRFRRSESLPVLSELERMQTPLPAAAFSSEQAVVAFFPIVPWPSKVEIAYEDGGRERSLVLAGSALASIHRMVDYRPEPDFPVEAMRRGYESGEVRAVLSIDMRGDVTDVRIVRSSLPFFVDEARATFGKYKYAPGAASRTSEEVMRFRRRPE